VELVFGGGGGVAAIRMALVSTRQVFIPLGPRPVFSAGFRLTATRMCPARAFLAGMMLPRIRLLDQSRCHFVERDLALIGPEPLFPSGASSVRNRRTQADLLVVISLYLEQRTVVIGVEDEVSRESSCQGSRQAEEE
jgi:hypothetical protein